jgi:hypothetical protein
MIRARSRRRGLGRKLNQTLRSRPDRNVLGQHLFAALPSLERIGHPVGIARRDAHSEPKLEREYFGHDRYFSSISRPQQQLTAYHRPEGS